MNILTVIGLLSIYVAVSMALPPLDLRPLTRAEAARLPFSTRYRRDSRQIRDWEERA